MILPDAILTGTSIGLAQNRAVTMDSNDVSFETAGCEETSGGDVPGRTGAALRFLTALLPSSVMAPAGHALFANDNIGIFGNVRALYGPAMTPSALGHLRDLMDARHEELAELLRGHEGNASELSAAMLERESDWLREAQAELRQFLSERAGADSFAKRRSV